MGEMAVKMLLASRGGFLVDATVGTGGHTELILRAGGDRVEVLGIDRDPLALEEASKRLDPAASRVKLVCGNFREIGRFLGPRRADGFLLDLGLSSLQLSDANRGFSYLTDGPLDMAMGTDGHSVRDLLASATEWEIGRIIRDYGEERRSGAIAREIVRQRDARGMETTLQLRGCVAKGASKRDVMGTLSRVFQAFRIWANEELENLSEFLPHAVERLTAGGRIVVISYHSLEDRMVKRFFRQEERGCICPADFPECRCGKSPRLMVITRSAVRPSEEEVGTNPRSRSARLRAAERL
jgi:16S rRNA (cytosine1402-N4)-methyltransferase